GRGAVVSGDDERGRDVCFFFQAEDGIRDLIVTGVQTCALPIFLGWVCTTAFGCPVVPPENSQIAASSRWVGNGSSAAGACASRSSNSSSPRTRIVFK